MKATGIVRRIDDLGRVVIPKEIRRTMKIREGSPLEIYTDHEGEVIFKKYSPIGELSSFASQYAETVHKTCKMAIIICDRDTVIACAGVSKRDYLEKPISDSAEKIIEGRALYQFQNGSEQYTITRDGAGDMYIRCAMPILTEGDVIGCVISAASTSKTDAEPISPELEAKLVQTAANFLGKQLES
jgi:AbrB family transcriptional regulator (stage V sporulation protein T)